VLRSGVFGVFRQHLARHTVAAKREPKIPLTKKSKVNITFILAEYCRGRLPSMVAKNATSPARSRSFLKTSASATRARPAAAAPWLEKRNLGSRLLALKWRDLTRLARLSG
jgi:hypothetical protein